MDYFRARYYSNTLGRFISADWSVVPVPIPYANLPNPQSLNLYSYVNNNPINFRDIDGHTREYVDLGQGYRAGIDKGSDDFPNIHVFKGKNEIARARFNADNSISWSGNAPNSIKDKIRNLGERKGMFQRAKAYAERLNSTARKQADK